MDLNQSDYGKRYQSIAASVCVGGVVGGAVGRALGGDPRSVGVRGRSASPPCVVSIVLYCLRYNKRRPRAWRSSPPPALPRLFVILNGAVHSGYWSASRRACLRHIGERRQWRLQYPECPAGVDRVSYYNTGEEEEVARGWAPSCLWDWFNWDTGSPVFVACRTWRIRRSRRIRRMARTAPPMGRYCTVYPHFLFERFCCCASYTTLPERQTLFSRRTMRTASLT